MPDRIPPPSKVTTDAAVLAEHERFMRRQERPVSRQTEAQSSFDGDVGDWSKIGLNGPFGSTAGPEARVAFGRVEFCGEGENFSIPGGWTTGFDLTTSPIPAEFWPESNRFIEALFWVPASPGDVDMGVLVFQTDGDIVLFDGAVWQGQTISIVSWETVSYRISDVAPI